MHRPNENKPWIEIQVKEKLIEAIKESISQGWSHKPVLEKYSGGQAGFRWLSGSQWYQHK